MSACGLAACDSALPAPTRSNYEGCAESSAGETCGQSTETECLESPLSGEATGFDTLGYWCTHACGVDSDCPALAGHTPKCMTLISRTGAGSYCTIPCDLDNPRCPTDTTCESEEPANGGDDVHYCLP